MVNWKSKPPHLCKNNPKFPLQCPIGLFLHTWNRCGFFNSQFLKSLDYHTLIQTADSRILLSSKRELNFCKIWLKMIGHCVCKIIEKWWKHFSVISIGMQDSLIFSWDPFEFVFFPTIEKSCAMQHIYFLLQTCDFIMGKRLLACTV